MTGAWWLGIGAVLVRMGLRVRGQPRVGDRIAYWHQTVRGLDETQEGFYTQVHEALVEGWRPDVALVGLEFGPDHLYVTQSILSGRALYLRARYQHLSYYLYAGRTPAGLYLSSWLYSAPMRGLFSRLSPLQLEPLQFADFGRQTLYQYDATLMFFESVHAVVLGVLDAYVRERGLRPLEEFERRPVLHAFYGGAGAFAPPPGPYAEPHGATRRPLPFQDQEAGDGLSGMPFSAPVAPPHPMPGDTGADRDGGKRPLPL